MGGWDWTEDARLLVARARKHRREFDALISGNEKPPLWSVEEKRDADGRFSYALWINPTRLTELKPVAADLANNLVHALDQGVAALARLRGVERSRSLYFPWSLDDEQFRRALEKLDPVFDNEMVREVLEVRERHRRHLPHFQMVKEVSNSGKHWALVPSQATVSAVAMNLPGKPQQIWQIPEAQIDDYFYEFCKSDDRLTGPFLMVVGLRFYGLEPEILASPDAVFDATFRYVEDMIATLYGDEEQSGVDLKD